MRMPYGHWSDSRAVVFPVTRPKVLIIPSRLLLETKELEVVVLPVVRERCVLLGPQDHVKVDSPVGARVVAIPIRIRNPQELPPKRVASAACSASVVAEKNFPG
jgi:hypothetical protein